VLAAAIITGLRLARAPRAGSQTERVIDAVKDGIFLANQIYDKALLGSAKGILTLSGEYRSRSLPQKLYPEGAPYLP